MKEFVFYLVLSLAVVFSLTALGGVAASNLSPYTEPLLQRWIKQSPATRFDDFMDAIVLANVFYKKIEPRTSLWTYFLPYHVPRGGWELLGHVLSPGNRVALIGALRDRQGELLYRYWTGHICLTALALYVYTSPAVASKATLSLVIFALFLFLAAWRRRLGLSGALCLAAVLLGSGAVYLESFHTHAWGLAFAFLTAAYTGKRLAAGKSYVAPAVVGAVFANWVGYDYVFPTIAFSLPLFLARQDGKTHIEALSAPLTFTLVFLAVTALMMVLRVPVSYLFENCPPSKFLSQLVEQVFYRVGSQPNPHEIAPGIEISRRSAVLMALPAVNSYLFNLGGRLIPRIYTLGSYIAFQAMPIVALMGILAFRNRASQFAALKPALVAASCVLWFHIMLIALVNHACVHPWMHARYMVFALAVSWAVALSALAPADLWNRISERFSNRA